MTHRRIIQNSTPERKPNSDYRNGAGAGYSTRKHRGMECTARRLPRSPPCESRPIYRIARRNFLHWICARPNGIPGAPQVTPRKNTRLIPEPVSLGNPIRTGAYPCLIAIAIWGPCVLGATRAIILGMRRFGISLNRRYWGPGV